MHITRGNCSAAGGQEKPDLLVNRLHETGKDLKKHTRIFLYGCAIAILIWILLSDFAVLFTTDSMFSWRMDLISDLLLLAFVFIINNRLINRLICLNGKLETAEAEKEKTAILLSAFLEGSPETIMFSLDTDYCYTAFNRMHKNTILSIWGVEIETGMNMLEAIGYEEDRQKAKENFDRAFHGETFTLMEEYGDSNRSRLYWQNHYCPVAAQDGSIIGLTCSVLNITMQRQAEEQNSFLSYHDQLTGLYNRRFYEERIKQIDTENCFPLSLIVADVNGLKFTNDVFGHISGDHLIKAFAEILIRECRSQDIVARIGGDEFVILLPRTNSIQLKKIIKRLQEAISGSRLEKSVLSVSFGWATKHTAEESYEQVFRQADDLMYNHKLLNKNDFDSRMMSHLNSILAENNPGGQAHGERVSALCRQTGIRLSLGQNELNKLEKAGLMHDIGKAVIDKNILMKSEKLKDYELREIKRHSEIGYKILSYFNRYRDIAEYVLYHHERPDGTGYPMGLKGAQIPLCSRIISIANAYDSMTEGNTYGEKRNPKAAIKELTANAGTQFDFDLTGVFVQEILSKQ